MLTLQWNGDKLMPPQRNSGELWLRLIYIERGNMDVIKEREIKRTVDDKGGSERNGHSPITAVE